jgi:hypothetical protein
MVYRSDDGGSTWVRIGTDLPKEPVNVIKEDPVNENLLYVGTDHGLYISLDGGETFMIMDKSLPHVPVHDLVIQPTAQDLVIGTHGRSIYRASVKELEQLNTKLMAKEVLMFGVDDATYSSRWGDWWNQWYGANEPAVTVPVYVKNGGIGKIDIYTKSGTLLFSKQITLDKGINYVVYNLTINADKLDVFTKELKKAKSDKLDGLKQKDNENFYIIEGDYKIEITVNGASDSTKLKVKEGRKRPERKPQKKIP